jgi:hypothetical protein
MEIGSDMKYISFAVIICSGLFAQQRELIYINAHGVQEVISLTNEDSPRKIIEQYWKKGDMEHSASVFDTLKYYSSSAEDLTTNFGFWAQETMLEWFLPETDGEVIEFGWLGAPLESVNKIAYVRAWYIDPRLTEFPKMKIDGTGGVGYYLNYEGGINYRTPYKEDSQDSIFRTANVIDSQYVTFDPLKTEAAWNPGGVLLTLESNAWHTVKIKGNGASFPVRSGQPIGFTVQNTVQPTDSAFRMAVFSRFVPLPQPADHFSPSHSLKFYHLPVFSNNSYGWYSRSYDFGMYVVVSYFNDNPKYIFSSIYYDPVFRSNTPFIITAHVKNLTTGSIVLPSEIEKVEIRYKVGNAIGFQSVHAEVSSDSFKASIPAIGTVQKLYFYVVGYSNHGARFKSDIITIEPPATTGEEIVSPKKFHLQQNYPNPFNPSTTIEYSVSGSPLRSGEKVSLKVYDLLGKEVAELVNGWNTTGMHRIGFFAPTLPGGVYFYTLRSGPFVQTRRMLLLK